MAAHWIDVGVLVAMSGVMAFGCGRAPLPKKVEPPPVSRVMTMKQLFPLWCVTMVWVLPGVASFTGLFRAPLELRATAVCGSYVVMAMGWFIGNRIRERKGQAPFAFQVAEDRVHSYEGVLARFLTPRRMMLIWVVLLFGGLILNQTWLCNSPSYRVRGFSCERVSAVGAPRRSAPTLRRIHPLQSPA